MTTLYGGTQDYGLPTTLQGWSEYSAPQAPVYYNPVQQNYATQTNNNTTVKNQAPLIVPDLKLPDLPTAPNYQMGSIPDSGGGPQMFNSATVTPVGQLLGNAAGPEGAYAVAPGGPTPSATTGTTGGVTSTQPSGQDIPQPDSPAVTQDPARFAPGLGGVYADIVNTPPRARGQAPASGSAPDTAQTGFGAADLREIYQDVANDMAQVPVQGLTTGQRIGFLISPEARKLGIAKLAAESKARADLTKAMIDDRIAARQAEMAKELNAQQESELISKFIDGTDEQREGLMRRFPFLNSYKDIPQSRENSLAMAAKQAGHVKEIAGAAMDIYKLLYHKDKIDNEQDQLHYDTITKGLNVAKAGATYQDEVNSSHASARKAGIDADIAESTKQDKIDQSHLATQLQQWDLANQPTKFMSGQQDLIAKYNSARQAIQDGQMSAAKGTLEMGRILSAAAADMDLVDKGASKNLRDAAMSLFNLGAPEARPKGIHFSAELQQWVDDVKGKPVDYNPPLLGSATLGSAATAGAVSTQGGMMAPQSPMLIQGGVSDSTVQQFKPGQNQLQLIPPPPPMAPSIINNPNGLPMAGLPQGGIGGGVAGHQAPGGGFIPPPPPGMVPPQLLQQYPQLGGAVPASMGAPQQPLQGGVQTTDELRQLYQAGKITPQQMNALMGQQNPIQAFNQSLISAMQAPQQAAPTPASTAPPSEGFDFFERGAKYLQSGKGHPPLLSKDNPPQGAQRFLLGGAALGGALVHGIGRGLGGAINRAVQPYRMPPPEEIKAQYEAQAEKNADKVAPLVVTPWVTPESRGFKQGAMLTDPELYSYFAHKGRDTFTMRALIRRAGWTLPPEGFNGGNPGAPQPMTHDYERFKRFNTGGPPPLPKPGDDAPYTQFNPALLPQNMSPRNN